MVASSTCSWCLSDRVASLALLHPVVVVAGFFLLVVFLVCGSLEESCFRSHQPPHGRFLGSFWSVVVSDVFARRYLQGLCLIVYVQCHSFVFLGVHLSQHLLVSSRGATDSNLMDHELSIQSAQFGVWGRRHCGFGQLTLLGTDPSSPPLIIPMRRHLDSMKRMMQSDFHIGTGSRQWNLKKSGDCEQFRVESHGSDQAIVKFEEHLKSDQGLLLSSL